MMQQAMRGSALPDILLCSSPPWPRSSLSLCTCISTSSSSQHNCHISTDVWHSIYSSRLREKVLQSVAYIHPSIHPSPSICPFVSTLSFEWVTFKVTGQGQGSGLGLPNMLSSVYQHLTLFLVWVRVWVRMTVGVRVTVRLEWGVYVFMQGLEQQNTEPNLIRLWYSLHKFVWL